MKDTHGTILLEAHGAIHNALSVVKKRIGDHEGAMNEIAISGAGISVGAPLVNFCGVLSGTAELLKVKSPPPVRCRGDEKRR
jgi:circadian clock protein KaiC